MHFAPLVYLWEKIMSEKRHMRDRVTAQRNRAASTGDRMLPSVNANGERTEQRNVRVG